MKSGPTQITTGLLGTIGVASVLALVGLASCEPVPQAPQSAAAPAAAPTAAAAAPKDDAPASDAADAAEDKKLKPIPKTATKLIIEDIKVGTGAKAEAGKTVFVDYRGQLTDGSVFDESYSRGKPFDFVLGAGGVIKGWDQGVVGMKVGGKRRLIIPADLAYGDQSPTAAIPPGSTLVFKIELRDVK